ncbi:MAG: NUDIX hydrolase [Desulfofustis sp.]|nr:NUDIX hydrolase [Desulfofustis sp.]
MNYCPQCGAPVTRRIPEADDRPRFVCDTCKVIHYQNPIVVVGTIPESEGRILLCRRGIEPALNKWTLPAGYLEIGETLQQGAARETLEEAGYQIVDLKPYAITNIVRVNQVYIMFTCGLGDCVSAPGSESLEVKLFTPEEIPWQEIAFRSIHKTLKLYCTDMGRGNYPIHLFDIT